MKKKLLKVTTLLLIAALLVCGMSVIPLATAEVPTVSIDKFNLTFESDTYIKYAVKFSGVNESDITRANTGMLYWTSSQESYAIGSETSSSDIIGYTTIDGVKYYTFAYDKFAAKQMTDYVWSVAYIVIDGVYYYSAPVKYSVLTYAYDILGYTGEESDNEPLKAMLLKLLDYGAAAQELFSYKKDRLANDKYYQVSVSGGTLADGSDHGLFLEGEQVTLVAPVTDENGVAFSHWADKNGNNVSTAANFALTVKAENNLYTPIYGETVRYSEGLEFEHLEDGLCILISMGDCTDTDLVIPPTSPDGDIVVEIDRNAFSNEPLISVSIPATVETIGRNAFSGCTSITDVYYDGTAAEWEERVTVSSGNTPLLGATMHFKSEHEYTEPTIYMSNVTASAGDTIEIKVSFANNPGVVGMTLILNYDESALQLVSADRGKDLAGLTFTSPEGAALKSGCKLPFDAETAVSGEGEFLVFTFKVLDGAAAGDYSISLDSKSSSGANTIIDNDLKPVEVDMVAAIVTVK